MSSPHNPAYQQLTLEEDAILIGYAHASLIGCHRPDVAYPGRKVRRAKSSIATIHSDPCDCPDDHVEVWVRRA